MVRTLLTVAHTATRWLLAAVCCFGAASQAAAPAPLELGGDRVDVDLWQAVSVLVDAERRLDVADVLQRLNQFAPPDVKHANFGARSDAMWLYVPLRLTDRGAADDGEWVLDIDYAALDRVDVFVLADDQPVQQYRLGDELPFSSRSLQVRPQAVALTLSPGRAQALLLRVETTSTMVLPLRLIKAPLFASQETRFQLLQGVAAGIVLCLCFYALGQWGGTRDPMYLYYLLMVGGVGAFFFAHHGLAAQYLWPDNAWLADHAAVLAVLAAMSGGFLFVERLLDVRSTSVRLARAIGVLASVSLLLAALFALDLIGYRTAQVSANVLGPLPILLALHLAIPRLRRGDPAASYLVLGWLCYLVGAGTMALMLRGWLPSNDWTRHAFQIGSLCEALAWLRLLGMYAVRARLQAERAGRERDLLQQLAHTDALTGLPNRRGLDIELARNLPQATAERLLVLYLVDLDGFKAINDRMGHDAGDDLLVQVGKRLRAQVRESDTVARLGGDEFVVLAQGLPGEHEAWRLGQKLVASFGDAFELRGQTCRVGLTVGFAVAPLDGGQAKDLLRRADAAMYAGKQSGKGTVRRGAASAGLAGA